jgi:transposase
LETFTGLLGKHLETFRELESLQAAALQGVKNQVLEGLAGLMTRQADVMAAIAREKSELRPFLDQWEGLKPEVRQELRNGKAGDILTALETVAKSIQAKHQEMFGEDLGAATPGQGGAEGGGAEAKPQDLSQTINIYRALQ